MNLKIKWLRDKLSLLNIDGMIITNPINIRYLTNINAEGTLLITKKENIYITDGRYIEYANSVLTIDDEILVSNVKDVSIYDYENFFILCENVGFEENYVTFEKYNIFQQLYKCNNLVETEGIIEKQRCIKDIKEIDLIKRACEITDECFSYLLKYIKKGMTEKEIALEIERYYKINGADGVSFEPIVAINENASKPHNIVTDKKIESGDLILIDMGCKYKGYCSDMTRTIFMDYMPEIVKPTYDLVLKNNIQTINDIKDNKEIKLISKIVENDFELHNETLIHGLGHGVGLEIHELPFLSSKNSKNLKENMVVTVEPGIYDPGKFGIRIEDTVLVTKSTCITLTKSGKDYIIIK